MSEPPIILTDWHTRAHTVQLSGADLPEPPLQLGGRTRRKVTRYAGTDEVSAQMLGLELDNIKLKGRIEDKDHGLAGYARQAGEALEQMWRAQHLVRFEHGPDVLWGILDLHLGKHHEAEFEYSLEFEPLWDKPPEAQRPAKFEAAPPDAADQVAVAFEEVVARAEDSPSAAATLAAELLVGLYAARAAVSQALGVLQDVADWADLANDVAAEVQSGLVSAVRSVGSAVERTRTATASVVAGQGPSEAAGANYMADVVDSGQRAKASAVSLLRRLENARAPIGSRFHTVGQGDTLEQLARHYYGDFNLWQYLADANPQVEANALQVGDLLVIPEL